MNAPLISVAIPTYNRAGYLRRAIACLLNQEHREFELIVSDNASTDGTEEVVASFRDSRICYYRNEANVGMIENFWRCGPRASGEWIVIHQDDDLLHPMFLARCARAIALHPEIVMYVSGLQYGNNIERLFSGYYLPDYFRSPWLSRWDQPQPRIIPGRQVAALSLWSLTFAAPAQATRRSIFLELTAVKEVRDRLIDVNFTGLAACRGDVAYDAYLAGLLQRHPHQWSSQNFRDVQGLVNEYQRNALRLFEAQGIDCRAALREVLPELDPDTIIHMLKENTYLADIPLELLQMVAAYVNPELAASSRAEIHRFAAARAAAALSSSLVNAPRGRLDRMHVPGFLKRGIRGALHSLRKRHPRDS